MMFVVRIFFFGLVMFVPENPGMEDCGGMPVLLPDVRGGFVVSDGTRVEPHTPCLQWGRFSANCRTGQGWELDRERIEFKVLNSSGGIVDPIGGNFKCKRGRGTGNRPTMGTQTSDFSWTVLMESIPGVESKVNPIYLDSTNPASFVVARTDLAYGTIETCRLIEVDNDTQNRPRTFDFKPLRNQGPTFKQALAEIALSMASFPASAKEVQLTLVPFENPPNREPREVTIKPRDCGGGVQCVDLLIWNMPPESNRDGIARHFEIFYHLLEDRPDLDKLAVPMADLASGSDILQAECELPPGVPQAFKDKARTFLDELLKPAIGFLGNRPACPMVQGSSQ